MTTYNTYQEAKIANQDCDIYKNITAKFKEIKHPNTSHYANGWRLCKPSDYCMTVEKFFDDGYKFVEGDLILDDGLVYLISDYKKQDYWYETELANEYDCDDRYRYILHAAALELNEPEWDGVTVVNETESEYDKGMREAMKKIAASCGRNFAVNIGYEDLPELVDSLINPQVAKPRTKVEYVKCVLSLADFIDGFDKGLLFYYQGGEYHQIGKENQAMFHAGNDSCFVKKETTMTEREEFIDEFMNMFSHVGDSRLILAIASDMEESGKFKLVN